MQQKGDEEKIDSSRARRASWARLLRKIFEVDPLLCTCGAQMKIVSFITEPRVVDRILRHLASEACKARDPFDPRAPPAAASPSPTSPDQATPRLTAPSPRHTLWIPVCPESGHHHTTVAFPCP